MKFSKYNLVESMDYGLILYNMLNSKYVKLKTEKSIEHFNNLLSSESLDLNDAMVKSLYEQGYIVDDDINEYELAKDKINRRIESFDRELSILLYVTEQCNFRCLYCPEKHVNKIFSDESWEALYSYIEKNIKNGTYDNINISFFGGEPLLEVNRILSFLEKLECLKQDYPNVYFHHDMTTNGYLLTPEIYDKLTVYDVTHYQITVDGFEDNHNKFRPRVDGKGTWAKIIENLKYINTKNDKVTLNLRSNVGPDSVNEISSFFEWALKIFNNEKFMFSVEAISDNSGNVPEELTTSYTSDEYMEADSVLNKTGRSISEKRRIPLRILGMCCGYSMIRHCYTITTDRKVSRCGECGLGMQMPVGELSLNGDITFYDNFDEWMTNFEIPECENCEIYPLCGARSCIYKKVISKDGIRYDCENMKEIKPYVSKYVKEGFLD